MKKQAKNSELDIVNKALELSGQEKLRGFNHVAESYRWILCREYTAARMLLLCDKEWDFSIREEDIKKLKDKNAFAFSCPPVKILEKSSSVKKYKHSYDTKKNKHILVVLDDPCPKKIHVKYVEDVVKTEDMPQEFLHELVDSLTKRFRTIFKQRRKEEREFNYA